MYLREVPLEELRTGDRVISRRGRPGKMLVMSDVGVSAHVYLIVWSIEGQWEAEKPFISVDSNIHGMNECEYPIAETDIQYLGQA